MGAAVSVIVPARNAIRTLPACLRALLDLERPPGGLEIMVVDNASTDGTALVARDHGVLCLSADAMLGSYYARNEGARLASGRILAFTDADCTVDGRWLTMALKRFDDPRVGAVAGRIEPGPATSRPAWYQTRVAALNQGRTFAHAVLPYAQTANCLVHREAFHDLGGFDAGLRSGGDADLCWRLIAQGRWTLVYEPTSVVVHHHRSTWKGLFLQTLGHTRGRLALEDKHRRLFLERGLPLRAEQAALRVLTGALVSLGGRTAVLLGAGLTGRREAICRRFGDLVCSAAFHAAVCGRILGAAR